MVRQYHVKLKPASSPDMKPRAGVTVQRWGPKADDTQCAYLEDASTPERGIYVVDRSDRDCDGFEDEAPNECRANVWNGRIRPAPDTTRCLRMDTIPTNTNPTSIATCVLGGPGCVDGMDKAVTLCEPSTVCVPPAHCSMCTTRPNAIDCLAELPSTAASLAHIECDFFFPQAGGMLCEGDAVLSPKFTFPISCDSEQPYQLWSGGVAGWRPSMFTRTGMAFTTLMPTAGCDVTLEATPVAGQIAMAGSFETVLMYPLTNGRQAVIPLQIRVKPTTGMGCDDPINKIACRVIGDGAPPPAFLACVTADVIEPW